MGFGSCFGVAVLCWVLASAASSDPWGFPSRNSGMWRLRGDSSRSQAWARVDLSQLRALSPRPAVAVRCREGQLAVTVRRDLFGTGRPVRAAELSLGTASCPPLSPNPAQAFVTFVAALHECGSTLQVTPDSLIYRTTLFYKPTRSGNPLIVRATPAEVPIECHYPRRSNVSSGAVHPTWAPFRSTVAAEERLRFSLRLMDDEWSRERLSNGFQLGDSLRLQADVTSEGHVPLRLFVDQCVATASPDRRSSPRYAFIDLGGCLVDSRAEDTGSAFVSPRPRPESLRFLVDAFKFAGDTGNLLYISCHLRVSPAAEAPNSRNKACSFSKASGLWAPLEGTAAICSCCDTGSCPPPGGDSREFRAPAARMGRRVRRDGPGQRGPTEADVSVGPLLILEHAQGLVSPSGSPGSAGNTPQGAADGIPVVIQGLLLTAATLLSLTALGMLLWMCRKRLCPPGMSQ
ncbi:zona pellucida sperm-binding protein 3-like [Passer montanus]|uniref:zona pellucida sperm-binding protein 3-like n=1 Tax=Passer montanus TaxID=9160 RepID=UPI0019618D88|nr:zona pellucida sperm-binding protein 3-like [Passer montanus]